MNKQDLISNCKDPENRSKKDYCCGGHNHKNVKKNKKHHSTATKEQIKILRRFKRKLEESKDLDPQFADVINTHFDELI